MQDVLVEDALGDPIVEHSHQSGRESLVRNVENNESEQFEPSNQDIPIKDNAIEDDNAAIHDIGSDTSDYTHVGGASAETPIVATNSLPHTDIATDSIVNDTRVNADGGDNEGVVCFSEAPCGGRSNVDNVFDGSVGHRISDQVGYFLEISHQPGLEMWKRGELK